MGCLICGKTRVIGRGLCRSHYYKAHRRGELDKFQTRVEAGISKQDLGERLFSKIEKRPDGCWNWTGATQINGYGVIQMWPRVKRAHRIMYEHLVGPIPKGKIIRHTCDNKRCVNPAHLLPGTKRENALDCVERGGNFKPRAKLTPQQAIAIRKDNRTLVKIAATYRVSLTTVSNIKSGKRWATLWKTD